jgi:hypothetical protein
MALLGKTSLAEMMPNQHQAPASHNSTMPSDEPKDETNGISHALPPPGIVYADQSRFLRERRARMTASPPDRSVKALMALAGSISGALLDSDVLDTVH